MTVRVENEIFPFYAEITYGYYENSNWIEYHKSVVTFASSFAEAVTKIEQYYGPELCSIEQMIAYESNDIIITSLDVGRGIKRELEDV